MKFFVKFLFFVIFFRSNLIYSGVNNANLINKLSSNIDISIISIISYTDGLGRLAINFIENFKDELAINFINLEKNIDLNFYNYDDKFFQIIKDNRDKIGNVAILFLPAWKCYVDKMPNSIIKIAYSMFESTQIPNEWVNNLNQNFDLVVVPSSHLINIYKKCGVNIPIFLLPIGMNLNNFLNSEVKRSKNKQFTFGSSGTLISHKNHITLLKAFLNKFNNNLNFKLKIHGRCVNWGKSKDYTNQLKSMIKEADSKNVELLTETFNDSEQINFLKSLDCYILLSKGEGFSLTPREALSLGLPCILSNNTAHNEICRTGYVLSVKSNIKEPADYTSIFGGIYGSWFNSNIEDVERALEKVYINYNYYLEKSKSGREWVKQYCYKNLKKKYLNLIKPKKIILGAKNIITNNYIMTNSKELYKKYLKLRSVRDQTNLTK